MPASNAKRSQSAASGKKAVKSKPKATARTRSKSMAGQNKTVATDASVASFVAAVPDRRRRQEAEVIIRLMRRISGHDPRMWGPSIIGFGQYHYVYDSGREGDMPRIGFSPRKPALTLYLAHGFPGYDTLMKRLGKCTTSVACTYIKRLEDVNLAVLEELVRASWAHMAVRYPEGSKR